MTEKAQKQVQRPLSPHLQIYKPQLTSMMSIMHRMTGVGLSFGFVALIWFLFSAASGAGDFEVMKEIMSSVVGQILLFGWSWAACYHFCNGIRHLFWDMGKGFEIENAYRSGYAVLAVSTILTALIWAVALGGIGGGI